MGTTLAIEQVSKRYGTQTALDRVSFEVGAGEFFTLLGPSGCGKTTLLRRVAGFVRPDGGRIVSDGARLDSLPAHARDIGMVFQNYAVFPHLSAFENVAYGLRARRVPPDELVRRTREALRLVQLEELADRMPGQLSGGQQQRVALARALVIRPRLLLMDEPLSNLDARLRVTMRTEIRRIQRELGITTIYVTHDQEEALAISERLAIMAEGRVEQVGSPWGVYTRPRSPGVARFVGLSNVVEGAVVERAGRRVTVDVGGWWLQAETDLTDARLTAVFRPEAVRLLADREPSARLAVAARLGAAGTLDVSREELPVALSRVGFVPDVAMECSGSPRAFAAAIKAVRPGGRVGVVGYYADELAEIRPSDIMMRDLEVIGSVCPTGAWDAAVGLLAARRVDTEALITHVLPLERFDEAYRLARGGPGVIKVVLEV